jgi:hypothetical protein
VQRASAGLKCQPRARSRGRLLGSGTRWRSVGLSAVETPARGRDHEAPAYEELLLEVDLLVAEAQRPVEIGDYELHIGHRRILRSN